MNRLPLGTGVAVLLLLLCLPARAADDGERLKAGDRDPAFLERVNHSINRGVAFVKTGQLPDGSWDYTHDFDKINWRPGMTALALLALLKSGVNRHDERIEKGFTWLRKQPFRRIYETGLTLMAIEARWREHQIEQAIRGEHTRAVARKKPKVPRGDYEWMIEGVRFILEHREFNSRDTSTGAGMGGKDVWGYPLTGKQARQSYADHSNTQFALLGLKSASRCGVRFPKDCFESSLRHFLQMQESSGPRVTRYKMIEDRKHGYVSYKTATRVPDQARGWAYGCWEKPRWNTGYHPTETTGSITAVGVASVLICLSELGAKVGGAERAKAERAVHDGLAWLDHHFTVETNPGHHEQGWLYYYLYAMERACVLSGTRNLGTHDWYREGAEFLMTHQSGDGAWNFKLYTGPAPATCMALLFLTKATVPVNVKITGR